MPRQTLEAWINNVKQFQSNAAYTVENAIAFIELRDKILKSLYNAGVGMLLGSDAPQIFNVPGFSIQHELKAMVDAGIPNYDALKSGTLNPAIFFGKENEFGMVKAGHSADLILLNANPLDDISAISSRSGVMVRGRWMPESEIQQRLAEIAAQNGY
jgi:imidazolonepropionase-like amidohydrolase